MNGSTRRAGSASPSAGSPYWLIALSATEPGARRQARKLEFFVLDIAGERVLPVFGDEEQADAFARTPASGGPRSREPGWEPRACSNGELVSLLATSKYGSGPCAGVRKVVLDPLPEAFDPASIGLLSTSRECFTEHLLGRGRAWFENARHTATPRKSPEFSNTS